MKTFSAKFLAETSENTPVDERLKSFTSELEAIDKYVPMKMTTTKERPLWITAEVVKLLESSANYLTNIKRVSKPAEHPSIRPSSVVCNMYVFFF